MKYTMKFAGVHPRVLFFEKDVQALKDRLQKDAALQAAYGKWAAGADAMLEHVWLTEEYADSVYSQHGRYYEIGDSFSPMAMQLVLLYRMTGDRS